jgi:transcriptional regulator with XRE-family HTH domain
MHPFIEKIMTEKGCTTLSALARKLGISQQTLYGYAFEGTLPRARDTRLADSLGISVGDLINALLETKAS